MTAADRRIAALISDWLGATPSGQQAVINTASAILSPAEYAQFLAKLGLR